MALPTQSNIITMDYPSRGIPFIEVVAKSGINTQTMDYPSRGMAFVTNGFGDATAVKDIIGMGIIAFPR